MTFIVSNKEHQEKIKELVENKIINGFKAKRRPCNKKW